jgi:hypothetical protein
MELLGRRWKRDKKKNERDVRNLDLNTTVQGKESRSDSKKRKNNSRVPSPVL